MTQQSNTNDNITVTFLEQAITLAQTHTHAHTRLPPRMYQKGHLTAETDFTILAT